MTTTNVIHVNFKSNPLSATQDDAVSRRAERKKIGRERLMEKLAASNELFDLKAEVRQKLAKIAALEGAPAMIKWAEQECLAAWKVRSCTNE